MEASMKLIGPPSKEAAQTNVVKMPRTERISRLVSVVKDKIMFLDNVLSPAKFGLAVITVIMITSAVIAIVITSAPPHVSSTTWIASEMDLNDVPDNIPPNTTVLDLTHNNITVLKVDSFSNLTDLRELRLSHNSLRDVQNGSFNGLDNLEILSLSSNYLTQLKQEAFSGLTSLKRLLLDDNRLRSIDPTLFEGLPRPLEISVEGNPLLCNTDLHRLQRQINDKRIKLYQRGQIFNVLVDDYCGSGETDTLDFAAAFPIIIAPFVICAMFGVVTVTATCVFYRMYKKKGPAAVQCTEEFGSFTDEKSQPSEILFF